MHLIRPAEPADAVALAAVLLELNASVAPPELAARILAIRKWTDQEILVAEYAGEVVGVCHVHGARLLTVAGAAEIQALAVSASHQRRGIGSRLLEHAVGWAYSMGYPSVRLIAELHRGPTHQFYETAGFARSQPCMVFEKSAHHPEVARDATPSP